MNHKRLLFCHVPPRRATIDVTPIAMRVSSEHAQSDFLTGIEQTHQAVRGARERRARKLETRQPADPSMRKPPASHRRPDQPHHRRGSGQGRASVPGGQTPVRLCEDPPPGPGQEPRPNLHALCARQPVPGSKKAAVMRTSLSRIGQTAGRAAQSPRNRLPTACLSPHNAIEPPYRPAERIDQMFRELAPNLNARLPK